MDIYDTMLSEFPTGVLTPPEIPEDEILRMQEDEDANVPELDYDTGELDEEKDDGFPVNHIIINDDDDEEDD